MQNRKAVASKLSFLAAFLALAVIGAQGEDVGDSLMSAGMDYHNLLDRLEEELAGTETFFVSFEQEKHLAILDAPVESTGCIWFQAPDSIRFEILEPFRSVLIISGKNAARYDQVENGWERARLSNAEPLFMVMNPVVMWLQGRFRDQEDLFEFFLDGSDGMSLVLTPKQRRFRQHVSAIEFEVGADGTRFESMTIREEGGDFTRLRFGEEHRGIAIDPQVFAMSQEEPGPADAYN